MCTESSSYKGENGDLCAIGSSQVKDSSDTGRHFHADLYTLQEPSADRATVLM